MAPDAAATRTAAALPVAPPDPVVDAAVVDEPLDPVVVEAKPPPPPVKETRKALETRPVPKPVKVEKPAAKPEPLDGHCAAAAFQSILDAGDPDEAQIQAALSRLKGCKDALGIAAYSDIQRRLIQKL